MNYKLLLQKIIRITVTRQYAPHKLELIPSLWSGPGFLGCSVLPLNSAQVI